MKIVTIAAAVVAVPIVSMARRGTLDQQRVATIRAGGRASDTAATAGDDAAPAIPEPRRSPESGPGSTSTDRISHAGQA